MNETMPSGTPRWINRTVVGIVLATFLSDVSHEMCTAVLPLYLASLSLGPMALGVMEGLADLLMSLSRLAGGVVGHHVERKRPWTALGYLTTTLATSGLALAQGLGAFVSLRGIAWVGRGFRSPLRDFMLADAVEPTHFGRAYGVERAGDMLGAVVGPLLAAAFIWGGMEFRTLLWWTLVPGLAAAAAIMLLTRDRTTVSTSAHTTTLPVRRTSFPRMYWMLLIGVFLFGLGDFSRTFVVLLAAMGLGEDSVLSGGTLSVAVLLYALHNIVSALAAYPAGHLGDRGSKLSVLLIGYGMGVGTNVLLALFLGSFGWLVAAIILSGVYIAIEETLEKAVVAELLPRELRSLGFGILACVNAVGDMASSLYVGYYLETGRPALGFGIAAAVGCCGVVWLVVMARSQQSQRRRVAGVDLP